MSKFSQNNLMILAIFVAGLILGGAILFVQMRNMPQETAEPQSTASPMAEQISIPEGMSDCTVNDNCIVVDTTCSFCCKYEAINAKHEQAFNEMFDRNCSQFKGQSCKCFDLSSYPKCINKKCYLVKWPKEKDDLNKPFQ